MRVTLHTNITLKEMLEDLVKWVLGEECKYGGEFYYRNGEGGYFEITEVDLMRSRFETEDNDFSEYDWELKESNIYVREEIQDWSVQNEINRCR
jgi:hypothetical protein